MENNFCPFIKGKCRDDCKFNGSGYGDSNCIIFEELRTIGYLHNEIASIGSDIEKINK